MGKQQAEKDFRKANISGFTGNQDSPNSESY